MGQCWSAVQFDPNDKKSKGYFCASKKVGMQRFSAEERSNKATHNGIKTVGPCKICQSSPTGSSLCVNIVTWNMNGKGVSSEDLAKLIGSNRRFDLFVVGLQEVPKCNLSHCLTAALADTHSLLTKTTLQSLHLYVFGARDPELFVEDIQVEKHAVGGCGGLIGRKKGAVATSMNVNGIRLAFISCHLSAHAEKVEQRNAQCRHISHSLFMDQNPYLKPFHITIWLGDLNYRLEGIKSRSATRLIRNDVHEQLLPGKDQLLQEAERGEVFNGYCEGRLSFKPTYKYNVGSNSYDTSYKVRVPSWTDRILFKTEGNDIEATLCNYESIDNIYSSDHKPVEAHFCLKFNDVDHPLCP